VIERAAAINPATLANPVVPEGRLTQLHGQYPSALGDHTHIGIDLAPPATTEGCAAQETEIHAFADGSVDDVTVDPGWSGVTGNAVMLKHEAAGDVVFYTTYLHMSKAPAVEENAAVKRGEVIGYVGKTGKAIGCHVHFEIKLKSEWGGRWQVGDQEARENIYGLGDVRLGARRENWENFGSNWIDPVWLFCKYPTGMRKGDPLAGDCEPLRMEQYPAGAPLAMLVKGDLVAVNDEDINLWATVDPRAGKLKQEVKGARGVIACGPGYEHCSPIFDTDSGRWYWRVRFESSQEGWIAEEYLDMVLAVADGCGCTFFDARDYPPKSHEESLRYLFESDDTCKVRMHIGREQLELRAKGRYVDEATGLGDASCRAYPEYVGPEIEVTVEFGEDTYRCGPDSAECEVTGYQPTITLKSPKQQISLRAVGGCGC
jgi:murein DD-endopeptidase MepM/ murein hydrolase activator NlpD